MATPQALRNRRRRKMLAKLKTRMGCADCGYNEHFAALQWDHQDPETKLFEINKMASYSLKKIFEEVRKCVVRCANCHAVRTYEEQHYHAKDN